jgi:hypothetical protein
MTKFTHRRPPARGRLVFADPIASNAAEIVEALTRRRLAEIDG